MTREEIYTQCVEKIDKTNCLLMELATGTGKTKISIDLVNHLIDIPWHKNNLINILILVAKRVHKQTWKEEIKKWGGIFHPTAQINICMECYESLKNHCREHWNYIIADEVHHIGSETRLEFLRTMSFDYFIGLSATVPKKLKQLFKYRYHAATVSCDIVEAIEDDILPEPQILLFPLILDNRNPTEEWEINAKQKGPVAYGNIRDIWKYKRQKVHAILSCTQKQKLIEYDKLIEWEKNKYMQTRHEGIKQSWLFHAGKRLEFLADCKCQIVSDILRKLSHQRTITFCKTIAQTEKLGKNCIHSQNKDAAKIYESFNQKKINHITAVNILNENANLVDCKFAIFTNMSSSEVVSVQRIGRSLRHKSPVIILPYYKDTREQEIVNKMIEGFSKESIKTINSIQEI
jgi:superfamily II DNA or RNA helicase